MAHTQEEIAASLCRPEIYGISGPVERIETHISIVFLAGDRAYKLKRAVRFPCLDFLTIEARRRACDAEVAINRRTAPELYLGVVPVLSSGTALRLGTVGECSGADRCHGSSPSADYRVRASLHWLA